MLFPILCQGASARSDWLKPYEVVPYYGPCAPSPRHHMYRLTAFARSVAHTVLQNSGPNARPGTNRQNNALRFILSARPNDERWTYCWRG